MALDLKTLAFALSISYIIQAIALYVLSFAIKKYRGVNEWALGSIFLAIGFIFMIMRLHPSFGNFAILLGNLFHFSGFFLFYLGTKHFINIIKRDEIYLSIYSLVFVVLTIYFTFFTDDLNMRIIIYSIGVIPFLMMVSHILIKYGKKHIRKASLFVSSIFILFSIFLIIRIIYVIIFDPVQSFFDPNFIQTSTFLMAISMGLLWTFGLIIIVNQRINSELIESRNQFELIFNTIPDAITISEVENGRLLNTNKGFSQLSGYSKSEIEGKSVYDINFWKKPEDRNLVVKKIIENGTCRNLQIDFLSRDGSEISSIVSATPISFNEKESILFVITDISELKQKENEIAQKNLQLEIANSEKDRFFSIIAHDLRGPFSSIIGLSEVLSDKSYGFSVDQITELASSLNKTAVSTNELLENLLEWSGLNRGTKGFHPQKFTFGRNMSSTLSNIVITTENKHISLTNNIPMNMDVYADPFMFQTICRNLLINAIKFTPKGGSVTLSVSHDEDGKSIFSVADTGIGMNREILDSLFKIETRNNRQGTNGEASSGLGLLLCKEFIEKHGGKIWAESEEGKGSIFFFTLE